MEKRFYRFAYYTKHTNKYSVQGPHQLRDGAACMELADVLYGKGYRYGGLLFNSPPGKSTETGVRNIDRETAHLRSSDLLVVTTRPPLSRIWIENGKVGDLYEPVDDKHKPHKVIRPGQTSLEKRIFEVLVRYFKRTDRNNVELEKGPAKMLPTEYRNRANLKFIKKGAGTYTGMRRPGAAKGTNPPKPNLTAAYLLYTEETWDGGPGLIVSFGMSGPLTLVWNYLVRTRYARLLQKPIFMMAEMEVGELPSRPVDMSFADDWKVQLLLPTQDELFERLLRTPAARDAHDSALPISSGADLGAE